MKLLITGVAGTGKTTLCQELQQRGVSCIDDATNGKDLGAWYDLDGKRLPHNVHREADFSWDNVQWGWDMQRLKNFFEQNNPAVVCGYTSNIVGLAKKYFDQVVLLDTSPEVINKRLRKRPSGYGFKQSQRNQVLADLPQLRKKLATFKPEIVDASLPVSKRADAIEKIIKSEN